MNALARFAMIGLLVTGCAATTADDDSDGADVSEDQLRKGAAEQWVYSGTLPHLDSPSVTVSLTAHTARVSGFVPEGWTTPLPYYVDAVQEGGRTKVAVVYPIATGAAVNSQPAAYSINRASPWVPTNDHATWAASPSSPSTRASRSTAPSPRRTASGG